MPKQLSFDKPPGIHLRSVKEESDASRLRSLKSFHRSSGMRGRCWIYVCDRWKDRVGLRGRMEGRAEVVFPTYTLFPIAAVSP